MWLYTEKLVTLSFRVQVSVKFNCLKLLASRTDKWPNNSVVISRNQNWSIPKPKQTHQNS